MYYTPMTSLTVASRHLFSFWTCFWTCLGWLCDFSDTPCAMITVCYEFALELFPSALSLQRKWMEAATVMPTHDGPGLAIK